jgi:hypothetical protein
MPQTNIFVAIASIAASFQPSHYGRDLIRPRSLFPSTFYSEKMPQGCGVERIPDTDCLLFAVPQTACLAVEDALFAALLGKRKSAK